MPENFKIVGGGIGVMVTKKNAEELQNCGHG